MDAVRAIVAAGALQLESPIPWPDGTEVEIFPARRNEQDEMSPAEIASMLAAMDRSEPLEMADEELAALEAECQAHKEWEKANFFERAEEMRRGWE